MDKWFFNRVLYNYLEEGTNILPREITRKKFHPLPIFIYLKTKLAVEGHLPFLQVPLDASWDVATSLFKNVKIHNPKTFKIFVPYKTWSQFRPGPDPPV